MQRINLARWFALLAGMLLAAAAMAVRADPPGRVARLGFTAGNVSFSPAADPENWVQARLNRPVFIGDRLWTGDGARLELELGTAAIRAGDRTSLTILNLDDRMAQIELSDGRIVVRVRSLGGNETFEVDTPNLAFSIRQPGTYRIEVDSQRETTVVALRDGRGEVYGDGASYVVERGQWYRFYGARLENDFGRVPGVDDLDRWSLGREARHDRAASARYVSRAMIGYADLDDYGTWTVVPDYGNVWVPRAVAANWSPYSQGHWAWIQPWGWSWVDDAPWGFAPFHYGRWAFANARWMWVPGPVNVRPVYAPALVAFVGGNDYPINSPSGAVRAVGWFPLGPGEVYRPAYQVTRNYFTEVNVTNTRVDNVFVNNIYSDRNGLRDVHYRYRDVPGAVTAVAVTAFIEARPVARGALPAAAVAQLIQRAPALPSPAVAPAHASVLGAVGSASMRPPLPAARPVFARIAPPPAPVFTPNQLDVNAGNVVDANPLRGGRSRSDHVRLIAPGQAPVAAAPLDRRGGNTQDGRGRVAAPNPEGRPVPPSDPAAGPGRASDAAVPGRGFAGAPPPRAAAPSAPALPQAPATAASPSRAQPPGPPAAPAQGAVASPPPGARARSPQAPSA
ncbi:MAG: hypothetical protein M3Z31_01480, partial [Pseudomonadota bacterium]|nr:hypothetical protein [Pseudomonadota bacterium]